jgi:hypothetical protein
MNSYVPLVDVLDFCNRKPKSLSNNTIAVSHQFIFKALTWKKAARISQRNPKAPGLSIAKLSTKFSYQFRPIEPTLQLELDPSFCLGKVLLSTMASPSIRSRKRAPCRGFLLYTILSLSLVIFFTLPSSSVATKVCQTFQPIKRSPLIGRGVSTTAVTAATTFPRGGGAAKISATATTASSSSISPEVILKSFLQTIADAKSHLVAAAVARAVSIFGMYPVDTIKTRMQMKQGDAFRINGLYKGVTGSLVGQVPYG